MLEIDEVFTRRLLQVEIEYQNKRRPLLKEKNKLWTELEPDRWVHAVVSCPSLVNKCTSMDEELLAHLVNVCTTTTAAGDCLNDRVQRATLTFKPNSLIGEEQLWVEINWLRPYDDVVAASGFTLLQPAKEDHAQTGKKRKRQASDFGLFSLFQADADPEEVEALIELLAEIELHGEALEEEEEEEEEFE
eukprot:TRINITY_DN2905_c0_g1_i1.p1 TRINITY_DN2905_c0_g1~~TRINITY_DN2905_c0_g1_i1.p1  ORF type:complete len:190 (+),score=55.53 TRINITY_DN2905_c0_g1_i1:167-736(+)